MKFYAVEVLTPITRKPCRPRCFLKGSYDYWPRVWRTKAEARNAARNCGRVKTRIITLQEVEE
jgi:hypothetical protein